MLAIAVALVSVAISVASVVFTWRQAKEAAEANWLGTRISFTPTTVQQRATTLRLFYDEGIELDRVTIRAVEVEGSPIDGFEGKSSVDQRWTCGRLEPGDYVDIPLLRRRQSNHDGYVGGDLRLQLTCWRRRRHRQLSVSCLLSATRHAGVY